MSDDSPLIPLNRVPAPIAAYLHRGLEHSRRIDATVMLTGYLVVLLAIPSNLTIGPLASYGRPSFLYGLLLFGWWLISRLQAHETVGNTIWQPVRLAFGALFVIALVSFSVAIFRGQPLDQVSPAESGLLRLLSWSGVLLVTLDGIRTLQDMKTLVRRLSIAGGILAALGLLQFFTHQTWLDWFTSIPGLRYDSDGVAVRGAFTRASGTAEHPLEYAVSLTGTLPLALATAVGGGFKNTPKGRAWIWSIPPILIIVTSLIAVSRSAIIGLVVAILASLPALPKSYRRLIIAVGVIAIAVISVLIPGMLTTTIALFTGASDDPSTQSRSDALNRIPDFVRASPLFGDGFGTFLPRYYIFDNQWALLLVELGILGVLAFAGIVVGAVYSAIRGGIQSKQTDTVMISRTLAASMLSIAVLFAFFDALSFPIAAGLFFFVAGLCGAVRSIGASDAEARSLMRNARLLRIGTRSTHSAFRAGHPRTRV